MCKPAPVHILVNSLRGLRLHFDPVHLGKQWKGFQMNQAFGVRVRALLGPSHRVFQECVCVFFKDFVWEGVSSFLLPLRDDVDQLEEFH